jgi:hypothetical protein
MDQRTVTALVAVVLALVAADAFLQRRPRVTADEPTRIIHASNYGVKCNGVADDRPALAATVAALPTSGGILELPAGRCGATSSSALLSVRDKNGVWIRGLGVGVTVLEQRGSGNGVEILGSTEITNTHLSDLSILGRNVGAVALLTRNLKDGVIERIAIDGFLGHAIDATGGMTYHTVVRDSRITAGAGAAASGRALNLREGTSWRIENNYFNLGGTPASPRYETVVDARGHDALLSIANVWDGAPTGLRSDGKVTSIGEFWDTDPTTGIRGFCYIHTADNAIAIIQPRALRLDKLDLSRFNYRKYLTFIGGDDPRSLVAGTLVGATLAPPLLMADQHDYGPRDGALASVWRLSSDAPRTVTGIGAGADGQMLTLVNAGGFPITLASNSARSSAANRIITGTGGDRPIAGDRAVSLLYDGASRRWRWIN